MTTYPYSDDYMEYDYKMHRYILKEKDVIENLAITDFISNANDENELPAILRHISRHIYNYIHSHNPMFSAFQNYIIAKTAKGREIIQEAMEEQLVYFLTRGDLTKELDIKIRELDTDKEAEEILLQPIPEIGSSICYAGRLRLLPHASLDDTEW